MNPSIPLSLLVLILVTPEKGCVPLGRIDLEFVHESLSSTDLDLTLQNTEGVTRNAHALGFYPAILEKGPVVKLFRYRKPSLKTLLGITKAKKRLKKELGITALMRPFRAWGNTKRRWKRKVGYESSAGRVLRNGLPRPGGCLLALGIVSLAFASPLAIIGCCFFWS
jgi:hypothetical protein